jgi:hypothetical protein
MYTPIKLSASIVGDVRILRQAVDPAQDKAVVLAEYVCPSDKTPEWVVWTCHLVPETAHTLEPQWWGSNGTYIRLESGFGRALDIYRYRAECNDVFEHSVTINETTLASRVLRGQY